ncbi:MAG TPA: protein-ADP-ribose hydrolase [Bacteroidales bacterium]|nr:protein-ADP-ribose hydrolase [Bacteroidales bacterium]HBZ20990.1 protein-ADP-ribose hydrolase [Bacteroidales bacterium]
MFLKLDDLDFILNSLLEEQPEYRQLIIPSEMVGKKQLMRSLMNLRPPVPISELFLKAQDKELQKQLHEKGIVRLNQALLSPIDNRLKLWQGDITRLKADAIVNAANSQMLGCFVPLHSCIDNAIHSAAGIQLRLECNELIKKQDHPEPTGSAKLTKAYNLPSNFVIHTVGPIIINGRVTQKEESQLADCYHSCLLLAEKNNLKSISFCCISTGEYRFPNQHAAEIAVRTVCEYFGEYKYTGIETVVFNVYKDIDYSIYSQILECGKV